MIAELEQLKQSRQDSVKRKERDKIESDDEIAIEWDSILKLNKILDDYLTMINTTMRIDDEEEEATVHVEPAASG